MKIVGKLYCIDGNVHSPRDQTLYVVGTDEVDKEQVREACIAYIDDYFGKEYFEKERGTSLKDLVEYADLSISYERHIPINKYSFDYDIWGSSVNSIGFGPGKGAKKVWVLSFNDNPWRKANETDI
ncbi:hypothetical protein MZO44_09050 [Lactiplantibacillus sp. E932]|uniref:hypothetical protein n=1 Tax=Lactiplantibacillus plantarum TaxID=1590 RepID=UPI0020770CA7|nr:hypothetical protein [Lactiplantibacillus plantarum]MCM8650257.1 hypothetical protein [Lactiplantibacillus sp. E932]MDO7547601.1 hypothetical protein [Lactiplantibacillus plantarum]